MPPVAAKEKWGSELGALGGGAPQTPAGGLRPPAPPAEQLLSSGCLPGGGIMTHSKGVVLYKNGICSGRLF